MPASATRRTVLQKVRGPQLSRVPQLVNTGFQVLFHSPPGVLFTFPSQYYALSVTKEYLALGGGPPDFPQGFSCLVVLWIPLAPFRFRLRGFHPLWRDVPVPSTSFQVTSLRSLTPACTQTGFGSFHFARRYFGNRCFFLFLALLRCFSSGGSRRNAMDSRYDDWGFPSQVSPFRDLRINGYLLLPEAFRSLSRLSSALSAKASTLCSFLLNQLLMYSVTPASFWLVLFSHSSNGCCLFVSFFGHVFPHNPSDVFEVPSGAFSFLFPFGFLLSI